METYYRFGKFVLSPGRRQLFSDGQALTLGARAFDLLVALVDRRQRIVAKNELLDEVWPGLIVEENNLQVHISALRKLLGPDAIATIPGRGYQFTLPIDLESTFADHRSSASVPPGDSEMSRLLPQPSVGVVRAPTVASNMRGDDPDLPLPDLPSIAVLPFANMTGESEQEYFIDGVTEDIITELSRFRSLFVIARNSTFSYKGASPDVRQVGRELGVRYVLEGSIRRATDKIRVTGQLIDAQTGRHIWAERYDRTLADIFALQEDLTRTIVTAIAPQIDASERAKARRRRPDNLSAYEIGVRASACAYEALIKGDRGLRDLAIGIAHQALAIDPRSTVALNTVAFAQYLNVLYRTSADIGMAWQEGLTYAAKAIEQDPSDCQGYLRMGTLLMVAPQFDRNDEALASLRTAHDLNPNDATAMNLLGVCEAMAGDPARGIDYLHLALRLAPRDPLRYSARANLAIAYSLARDYVRTVSYASLAINEAPNFPLAHKMLAVGYVGLSDLSRARAAFAKAKALAPEYMQSRLDGQVAYSRPEDRHRYVTFLRVAGGLAAESEADALR